MIEIDNFLQPYVKEPWHTSWTTTWCGTCVGLPDPAPPRTLEIDTVGSPTVVSPQKMLMELPWLTYAVDFVCREMQRRTGSPPHLAALYQGGTALLNEALHASGRWEWDPNFLFYFQDSDQTRGIMFVPEFGYPIFTIKPDRIIVKNGPNDRDDEIIYKEGPEGMSIQYGAGKEETPKPDLLDILNGGGFQVTPETKEEDN